uniref:Uncharacterized protein n=1 Tax=Anguilla anguilla TaxID=7936 RepID=A0A0E9RWJ5_ANGAN
MDHCSVHLVILQDICYTCQIIVCQKCMWARLFGLWPLCVFSLLL